MKFNLRVDWWPKIFVEFTNILNLISSLPIFDFVPFTCLIDDYDYFDSCLVRPCLRSR